MAEANRPVAAALLVLSATALFGLVDNLMRLAAAEGGLWQFHLLRAAVALALLLPVAWATGARLRPRRWGRVAARSALNAAAMVIYFACLGLMPIAQAVAGLFTAPLFVVLLGALLWGERPVPGRLGAVALGFAGILLALRLDPADLTPLSLLPVAAGAFYGLGNLATRRWCEGEGTLALLGAFFGTMLLAGGLGCLALLLWPLPVAPGAEGWATRGWVRPGGAFLGLIAAQAVASLLGVGLIIRAYQVAEAGQVAVFENALLVFATLWAVVLWGEVPGPAEALGLGLVAIAGVLVAWPDPRAAPA